MTRFFFLATIIIIIVALVVVALPSEKISQKIKIGVSDDISGFVVDFMIDNTNINVSNDLETYFIKDC